jgi:glycosyltransferase involved in cell wall biosynthesis
MQPNPIVTVICSCFNHEKFVIESIASVLNQSYKNIQLIVVDDSSSDKSVKVIEESLKDYPKIQFIKNKKNLSITKSFNHAMQFAKGDFIIDLAADDVLLSQCVEIQIKAFQNSTYKNTAIVYGNAELIHENGNHFCNYFEVNQNLEVIKPKASGDIYAEVISADTVICSVAAMYKKSVFEELNGYDERLEYEDFDFWLRVSRKYNIEFIDQILVKKRVLSSSLHASFHYKKSIGDSVNTALKTAYKLNKFPVEHQILKKRVFNEIKTALKNSYLDLFLKNVFLWLKINFKSKF